MICARERGRGYVEEQKSRHMEAQMIGTLKQLEVGRRAEDVAREVGVSKCRSTRSRAWKAKYGGMDVSQAQEAKQLRDENARLRKQGAGQRFTCIVPNGTIWWRFATSYGKGRCLSANKCGSVVDGNSIRSTLCDNLAIGECGKTLFSSFDEYVSRQKRISTSAEGRKICFAQPA